jgi:hypothetical protein
MKKYWILYLLFPLQLFAQKQQVNAIQSPKKESIQPFFSFFQHAPEQVIPYGSSAILFDFPKNWLLPDLRKKKFDKNNDSLNTKYNFCDSIWYANLKNGNHVPMVAKFINAKAFIDPSFQVPSSWHKASTKFKISKISLDANVASFLIGYEAYADCKRCEYPVHQYGQMLVSVNAQNQIIDKLYIVAERMSDLGGWKQFCFIDENKVIHLKEFASDELEIGLNRYEQYKMLQNGMFVRYYRASETTIVNDVENGAVANHMRTGEWIDKQPCFLISTKNGENNWVYAVTQYKNGLKNGVANYYQLIKDVDVNGAAILSSARKGKLLFVEMYNEGELVKREFVVQK